MFVGEVLKLDGAGAENVIVKQVTGSTTVLVQNVVNSHTSGITITLLSQRDSFIQKFTIWAQSIQQQEWGGTQNSGMKMSNYYWGNMRNEFEIGIITYGDNGSGPGSAPDNLIDNAVVNRWTNQIVANAGANGSLSGGIPHEGIAYGSAQFQYMIIPFFSAKDMGRDLILETPFMKQLLYWTLYSTTPSKTFIKDVDPNATEYFISTWSDDEVTRDHGGILWGRAYIEDGMNAMAQLFAANSPSTNLGPYARYYLNTLGLSIPLNIDPYERLLQKSSSPD